MTQNLTLGTTTYNEFKELSSEYFKLTLDRLQMSEKQVKNGCKTIGLLWLSRTDDWTEEEIQESIIILRLAADREFEVQLAHAWKHKFDDAQVL